MISLLRKVLVVALFVLLSAVLLALLFAPVLLGVAAYCGHWSVSPPIDFLMTISGVIALAFSIVVAAGVFLLVALILKRR